MANSSDKTGPSPSPSADSYIGSLISLTSKYGIRYEGVLCYLNPQDSTLGLENVRSYGSEGRKKDGPQIPPSDKIYEYILFRGSDIKDLQVKSSRLPQVEEPIHNDPAIIKSQFSTGESSSSKSLPVSSGSLNGFSHYDASALNMKTHPSSLSSQQAGVHIVELGPSQITQTTNLSSYGKPSHWQGYNAVSSGNAFAQQHYPSVATSLPQLQNISEPSTIGAPSTIPFTSSLNSFPPISSLPASNIVQPNFVSSLSPQLLGMPPSDVHSLTTKSALSSQPNILTANTLNLSSLPPHAQDVNKHEQSNTGKMFSDPTMLQSLSYSASSNLNFPSGPLLKQSPILLTPDQLSQSRLPEFTPEILCHNQNDLGVSNMASSKPMSSGTDAANQAPLMALEPGQQFTEEFDFEAMNEKFKKDEVWGYLGKAKHKDTAGSIQDNDSLCQTSGDIEGDGLAAEADSKPAYNKDEFFDSISCNTTTRRTRNGPFRFSERMKLDTETFGQVQRQHHPVYGGYGPGIGMNRNQYGWGRGYNSGSRFQGNNMWY